MKQKIIILPEKTIVNKENKILNILVSLFKVLISIIIIISLTAGGLLGGLVFGYVKMNEPINDKQLDIGSDNLTSFIYDAEGNILSKLTGKDNKNRVMAGYSDIPKHLEHALVAIEDERFYQHKGIDFKRTFSAFLYYFTGIGSKHGGSTITQQLVKNLTYKMDETPQRKVQEQWNAILLEKKLTKWQIITMYLNLIYMGNGCYGVQSAANTYFGKNVSELSLAECSLLAGITNEPGTYNPFSENGRLKAKERQELILSQMLDQGYIDEVEFTRAINEPLVYADPNHHIETVSVQSYFVDQAIMDVINDLAETYNISTETAAMQLYSSGYSVYTTMAPKIQQAMDEVFINEKYFAKDNKSAIKYNESPQAAMVVINPYNGHVVAMYGGSGEKTASRTLNRATQSERQAGSCIKPIAVYGPAIDLKLITPATIIDDSPVRYHNDEKLKEELYPINFSEDYKGLLTIRTAIQKSINVVAAKVWINILGPDNSVEYLKKVGIDREKEKYVSLALGGLEEGVNPLLMAGAYTVFPNKGIYTKPITYTKVVDKDGNILLDKKPERTVVYAETSAYLMIDMMKDVTKPGGTASRCIIGDGKSIPSAGKTGTTSFNIDKWFVGYTPYYVAAVWYGYDNKTQPISIAKGEEEFAAQNIWRDVMNKIHEGLDSKDYIEPEGLVKRNICIYSGKIPTDLCSRDPRGNSIRTEYFIKGTEPGYEDFCDVHVKAKVCTQSVDIWGRYLLAGPNCPLETVVDTVFVRRKEPYYPQMPNDPYPLDWQYELPEAEYCTVHGGPSELLPELEAIDILYVPQEQELQTEDNPQPDGQDSQNILE